MATFDNCRTILMADDDAEDYLLVREALQEVGPRHELRFVRDGEELFDYLLRRGAYAAGSAAPFPDLILLDLKMPKKDGLQVIKELKSDGRLKRIPVVALTTSTAEEDMSRAYDLGVNSYITKPATYRMLVEMIRSITHYWLETVELPPMPLYARREG